MRKRHVIRFKCQCKKAVPNSTLTSCDGRTIMEGRGDLVPGEDIPLKFKPEGVEGDVEAPRLRKAWSSNCLYWPHIFSREVKRSFNTANFDLSCALSVSTD